MKSSILGIMLLSLVMVAHAQKEYVVDPNAQQREITGSFTSIKVSGGIDLYLSQSDVAAVAVSASEDKFRDGIATVVENGVLKIYWDGDKGLHLRDRKMKAYVSFVTLEELYASGASDVRVKGSITGNSLAMVFSGASDFKGAVKVEKLKVDLSGASDVDIEGTATVVDISSSGASDISGYDLKTEICTAHASGASDIEISVNKELNAHASGASKIHFKGSGLIRDMNASGSSKISRRGR